MFVDGWENKIRTKDAERKRPLYSKRWYFQIRKRVMLAHKEQRSLALESFADCTPSPWICLAQDFLCLLFHGPARSAKQKYKHMAWSFGDPVRHLLVDRPAVIVIVP